MRANTTYHIAPKCLESAVAATTVASGFFPPQQFLENDVSKFIGEEGVAIGHRCRQPIRTRRVRKTTAQKLKAFCPALWSRTTPAHNPIHSPSTSRGSNMEQPNTHPGAHLAMSAQPDAVSAAVATGAAAQQQVGTAEARAKAGMPAATADTHALHAAATATPAAAQEENPAKRMKVVEDAKQEASSKGDGKKIKI